MPVKKNSFAEQVRVEQVRVIESVKSEELSYAGVADSESQAMADFKYTDFTQRLNTRAHTLIRDNRLEEAIEKPGRQFKRASQVCLIVATILGCLAAGNAVNRNFQPSGDQADTTSLLVSEGLSSSLHDRITLNADLKIYPSFASTEITSEWSSEVVAKNLTISDLTGKIYRREMFQAQSLPSLNIPVSDLPSSLYFVRLNTDKGLQTQKFIKL